MLWPPALLSKNSSYKNQQIFQCLQVSMISKTWSKVWRVPADCWLLGTTKPGKVWGRAKLSAEHKVRDDLLDNSSCAVVVAVVDVEIRAERVARAPIRVWWLEEARQYYKWGQLLLIGILPFHELLVSHSFPQCFALGWMLSRTGV